MTTHHRFFTTMQLLPIVHLFLLCTLLTIQPTSSQTNWFCGTSASDASLKCGVACPTGDGCPLGQYCFSGINSCSTANRYCGVDLQDANARCGMACPTGRGCPFGQACFLNTICGDWSAGGGSTSSSSSSSSSNTGTNTGTIKSFGHEAVEETFQSIKDIIDTKLFLYETPDMQWLPSTVYRFDGFFDGLQLMYKQGVNGKKIYMGGNNDPSCRHCHMYGLVNIAAFLAQAIKETIRYDACDENSWDRVGDMKMYPISNACGQLGQSYQDYHCKEEERFMECEVDVNMSIEAVTHAKWWGAPGPLFCGPKSQYPHTGYWDYSYTCDNKWATPPESCDVYEGQKGGKHIDDAPYANAAGRTDVAGCCWWGRGVIQTSGVCNFGKLNYFLGKRAHDEGRESRYPDIDFCRDPEAICANENHRELKWIAGFFYWVDQVQPYESGGWNYLDELHKFVDGGMEGDAFINSVSGIVNRGCHNPPCGTGALDGGPERAENFFKFLKEMTFAWVDVPPPTLPPTLPPTPRPTSPPTRMPTPLPTQNPTKVPTDPPYPLQTPRPISPPPTSLPTPLPTIEPTKVPTDPPYPAKTPQPTKPPRPIIPPPTSLPTPLPTLPPVSLPTSPPTLPPTPLPTSPPTFEPPPISSTTSTPIDKPYPVKPPRPTSPPPTLPPISSPTPTPSSSPTSLPTLPPKFELPVTFITPPTAQPDPVQTSPLFSPPKPISLYVTTPPTSEPPESLVVTPPPAPESRFISYTCGNGFEAGPQTFIDVAFGYELHNDFDTAASDALKEAKILMLEDIALRIGCDESSNRSRNMQQSEVDNSFSNAIGITSSKVDGLDLSVSGCTEEVQLETPTTCTPATGRFTVFAKSGTDQKTLQDISDRIKSIIEKSMSFGEYVTGPIVKTIYIGDRVETASDSIYTQSEPEPSKRIQYALYGLIAACLVLLCLLCVTLRSSRRRARKQLQRDDEELAFDEYMESRNRPSFDFDDEPQHINGGQNRYGRDSYMHSHSQRPIGRSARGTIQNWDDSTRPRSRSRGSSKGSRGSEIEQSKYSHAEGASSIDFSRASTNGSHDHSRASTNGSTRSFPPPPPPPRPNSIPIIQKQSSRGKLPPAEFRDVQAEDDSSDDDSSSDSSSSSSESDDTQDSPPNNDAASALSKDERRQRLEAAKARAASRRSARNIT